MAPHLRAWGPRWRWRAIFDGTKYYYGREQIFNDVTDAESNQGAQYIEDKWQVTKSLQLIGGLRHEQYGTRTATARVFLKVKDQIHPRLAFTWDVNGDSTTDLWLCRPLWRCRSRRTWPVRGANRSTFTRQYFAYTRCGRQRPADRSRESG
jgi:outer membrane receptor for ferric coprogen and ferric-rhodotorulic acid